MLPLKLDLTEVLVDFKRFERSTNWNKFWYGWENEKYEKPFFKKEKTNLPQNHKTPNELKTFLGAIKSEMLDPRNRNQEKCNLSPEELEALKVLNKFQRKRKIINKPCDKGAGVMILNFKDYLKSSCALFIFHAKNARQSLLWKSWGNGHSKSKERNWYAYSGGSCQ